MGGCIPEKNTLHESLTMGSTPYASMGEAEEANPKEETR
jgi:hypothetical protein